MKESPDYRVAVQIIADIRAARLLSPNKLDALEKKLMAGGLDEADWLLLTEPDAEQGARG